VTSVVLAILPVAFLGAAELPGSLLDPQKLEAVHQQRVEWMKTRRVDPPHGVYQDFRIAEANSAILPFRVQELAKAAGVQILLTEREPRVHNGVLWLRKPDSLPAVPDPPSPFSFAELPKPREIKRFLSAFKQYPTEFAGLAGLQPILSWFKLEADQIPLAPRVRHVLARELNEAEVTKSLEEKRTYLADEWLCDSSGFAFWAINNQGVFEIGDRFPMQNNTRMTARVPVPALLRILRNGEVIHEVPKEMSIQFVAKEPGVYTFEADLEVLGVKLPWIRTQGINIGAAEAYQMPNMAGTDATVESVKNISYVEGSADPKQKLDLYLPKGKTNFPIFVFIHGGTWVSGDRALYAPIGVLFAKKGIGVAIPSYRLMPKNPHPAQVDDVAAAFAWVAKNIGNYSGDVKRIYLGGHSAGGHLASLLALDRSLLPRHEVDPAIIKGVAALSGVYDLKYLAQFGTAEDRRKASPMEFVRKEAPPFLVSYCQWDYLGLPLQAKEFSASLRKLFVPARLLYVPGQTHITEVISMLRDGDPTTEGILRLIETGQP
jgi:acetyl esterase/lipase